MELQVINNKPQLRENLIVTNSLSSPGTGEKRETRITPFIEANTNEIALSHLKGDCIIPVFAKDNEQVIAHQEFIEVAMECAGSVFPNECIEQPEIRVSHQIKGRTPDAIHIPAKDLLDYQKTIYYERMAFIIRIPSITTTINGNNLSLTIGGVRSYNKENLFSKKKLESFKFFIGFQNMVCCNMCISTDGYKNDAKASSAPELNRSILKTLRTYKLNEHIYGMEELVNNSLSETQFAQLLGKVKLYHFLPKAEKTQLPTLLLNDNHFTTVARDFYQDKSFCRAESGEISLWNAYNLLTGANKSSYIDTFLDRSENAYAFAKGISKAINGDSNYRWYLS